MTILPTQQLDGIDLDDREPVGALLMAGLKKESGAIDPSTTDRWWIGARHAVGAGRKAVRPLHPSYAEFNRRDARPETRQMIRGRICHLNVADACQVQRMAWDLACCPSTADFPACAGDSVTAHRLIALEGREPQYEVIPCPGALCQYALGDGHPCNPSAKLYFRPDWREDVNWPRGMIVWPTHGKRSIEILLGFWCQIADEAAALGMMPNEAPYKGDAGRLALARYGVAVLGLPFELALEKRSSQGRKVTVVTITALKTFSDLLRARHAELGEADLPDYKLIGARSEVEHEAEVVAADEAAITDTTAVEIPRRTVEAEVAEEQEEPGMLFDLEGGGE